jgi:hypothetical protein
MIMKKTSILNIIVEDATGQKTKREECYYCFFPHCFFSFYPRLWVESPLYSSKRQTMATTQHLQRNLTAATNIIPKPTHHDKKAATLNQNAEIWGGSSKSKLIYSDAPSGYSKKHCEHQRIQSVSY